MSSRLGLESFLERIPWLAEVGQDRLAKIDRSEWHNPSDHLLARAGGLSGMVSANLMFYRRTLETVDGGLCTLVAAANLSPDSQELIFAVEAEHPECFVVAYARPVTWLAAGAEGQEE